MCTSMRVSGELDPIDRSFKFWKRVSLILGRFWSLSKQNEGSEFSVTGSATTTTLGTLSLPVFSFRRLCWPQRIHWALTRIETRSNFQQHDYFGPYLYIRNHRLSCCRFWITLTTSLQLSSLLKLPWKSLHTDWSYTKEPFVVRLSIS